MEKELKFDVIKEKIIKTDELIRLFKQKSDDLQRVSLINKQYKTRLESRKNEIDKTKMENDLLTTRLKTTDNKYQTLHDEHECLKRKYNELEQEYFVKINDHQVKFQTVSQELVDCREKLLQYEKQEDLNALPPTKSSKTNNNNINNQKLNELNGLKLQYSMLEQELKDLQKEYNLVVEALKKTEDQLHKNNSQSTKKETVKCDQKNCKFYKELANIQLENYNLRRELSDLRILEDNIDDLRKLEQEYEAVQKKMNGIKLEHDKKIEEIVSLNLKLDQYKLENDELKHSQQKNDDNNKKIKLLSAEIESLQRQKHDLFKENVDMKEMITKLSNEIREINATPSDSTIDNIMKEMIVSDIITPFDIETELEDNREVLKESTKLSTSSGDFTVSNRIENNLKMCETSKNINRRRKRKRIKNNLQNVDLLATLKALTESNIKFTISNESALTTNNFDFLTVTKTKLEEQKISKNNNKSDFLTKKLDCNLECCNGISSYYIMKNDDSLLGFLNIKNEINSNIYREYFPEKYPNDKPIISHDCSDNGKSSVLIKKIETSFKKSGNTLRRSLRLSRHTSQNNRIDKKSFKTQNRSSEVIQDNKINFPKQIISDNSNVDVDEFQTVEKKKRIAYKRKEQTVDDNDENKISDLHHQSESVKNEDKESKTNYKQLVCNRRRSSRSLSQPCKKLNNELNQADNCVGIDVNSPSFETETGQNVEKEQKMSLLNNRKVSLHSSDSSRELENGSNDIIEQESIKIDDNDKNKISDSHQSESIKKENKQSKTNYKQLVCNRRRSLRSLSQSCRKLNNELIQAVNCVGIDVNSPSSLSFETETGQNVEKEPKTSRLNNRKTSLNSSDSSREPKSDSNDIIEQESIKITQFSKETEKNVSKIPEISINSVEINKNVEKEAKFSFKRPVCSRKRSLRSSNQLNDEISCSFLEKASLHESVEEKSIELPEVGNDDDMNPQSPPPIDQGITDCGNLPKIIPLEKVEKIQLSKVKVLIEKLIIYSSEEKALEEIVQQFADQDPKYIAQIILDRVIADRHNKPDSQYTPPAPILTEIQRILLGFMIALEQNNVTNIHEHFLTLAEQYLFFNNNLDEILAITRLYLSVCKLRHDIHRIRKLCCEMFYFNYANAIPFFYVILTSWTEVLPFEIESKAIPLARILVQNVYISSCNQPGYNLLPLRDLLIKYYGYPSERWNSDELFDELFNIYRNNPIRSSDFNLLLLCKNHPEKWVYEMIHKHLIPFIDQITIGNFKAAVIILIGNLSHSFSTNTEYLTKIRNWMRSLITETTPDIVKKSVYFSLKQLMRKKKKSFKIV